MQNMNSPFINIAIVGGGTYCRELLEKSFSDYKKSEVHARISAVADPDPNSPGITFAKKIGLVTVDNYHKLYKKEYEIDLIAILSPEVSILEDILKTKPNNIRLLSYQSFEFIWKAIAVDEQKLKKRNFEVETILNGIDDFIIVINPEKEIIEANISFLEKMDYSPEEVIGKKCHKIFQNSDTDCIFDNGMICPLSEVIKNKRPHRQTLTRVSKKGKTRYVELSTFPVWEKNGKISKFIEVSRDITEKKIKSEEITRRLELMVEERTGELKETHDKLLHQDKMASLGKLAASVVHEINNPLAGVLNLTMLMNRIIEEDIESNAEIKKFQKYVGLVESETRRISRIVSNLLTFSRQSKMELKSLNLNMLIEQVLMLNSNLLKINGVKAKTKLQPDLPGFIGSEDQLHQVLMNFISNAVESMSSSEGGDLIIETTYSEKEKYIEIIIEDSGTGIEEENFSKLFEPFFTTKKKGKGVGLGLSVAYGIIKEHGGSINVNSSPGKGTIFYIRFHLIGNEKVLKNLS
ncbi:MAG: PAS domain-containing protein [Desulfobacterales bacterium]|jgi:two-component system, NtrC family, sensor kinase|nr:PAS domain-containing protein [Desulfobacteraceae bacterium]MBT4362915.1 PAS domain-containing protein [Desulfobacteraceae bacterium]MBT7085778.1 PAS domain-containing protein [Desulfobacterales bacterium]